MSGSSLVEILRPTVFEDLMQPAIVLDGLIRMAEELTPINMLFYGTPGIGKTSAARIMCKKLGNNWTEINGSLETGIESVRQISMSTNFLPIYDGPRVFFYDEADFLSPQAQAALRGVIEKSDDCRFLLTANEIRKFHPALKSRCIPICFDVGPNDVEEIVARLVPRIANKMAATGYQIEQKRLREVLYFYFPDLRAAIGQIEFQARRVPITKAA